MRVLLSASALTILLALPACNSRPTAPPDGDAFLQRQLAELRTLPAPEGVDGLAWDQLKDELRRIIELRLAAGPTRGVSTPPQSDSAKAKLLYDVQAGRLRWYFLNPGDYDQNGEVNISDLTPLGAHLGEAVPPNGANSVQGVIDGDGNGLLTISDLTPLGANLGRRITEFRVYSAASAVAYPDSNSEPPELPHVESVPVGDYSGNRAEGRVQYESPAVSVPNPGLLWIRPADSTADAVGTPSTQVLGGGTPPRAVLTGTPLGGSAPLHVSFDPQDSSHPPGSIYAYDPEGSGGYIEHPPLQFFGHDYNTAGVYTATLRIETPEGLASWASLPVNATDSLRWFRYSLPDYGASFPDAVPRGIGIGVDISYPFAVVSYYSADSNKNEISVFRSWSLTGNSWDPVEYNQLGSSGDLFPVIAGRDGTSGGMFACGGDMTLNHWNSASFPSDWSMATATPSVGWPIGWFSLKTIGGTPMVALHDGSAISLQFAVATNASGGNWNGAYNPIPGAHGYCASLTDIGGLPGLAYYDDGWGVYYASCSSLNPPVWNAQVPVTSSQARFFNALVTMQAGNPGLVYNDLTAGAIRWQQGLDVQGSAWTNPIDLAAASAGALPTAVMAGGFPHVFWIEGDQLLHAYVDDNFTWTAPAVVASSVDPLVLPAPQVIQGHPTVGYATAAGQFRFAIGY